MHPVPLIRSAALRPLLDHLAKVDSAVERRIDARLPGLRDGNALLPLSVGARAYELASLELDEPALGLHVGESTRLERLPVGAILRSADTLGAALAALVRQGSLYNTGQRYWLLWRRDDVWLHWVLTDGVVRGRQGINDLVLALLLSLVRRAAGPGWRPLEIRFEGAPPAHAEQLAALAQRCASFGAGANAFPIPKRLLALRLPPPDGIALRGLDAARLPSRDPLTSLFQAVEALLRVGTPTVASAAEAAGVSVRTLQRHLHAAGISFADVVQQMRFRSAARLLADPQVKVIEVSAALGYTDSANFTRAFRRWTGLSPQAFRRAARELPVGVSGVTPAL